MGYVLAIDFGTKRVGAAIGDPASGFAFPLETYHRKNAVLDESHYRKLIAEHDVERIVIGLPLHTSGRESEISRLAREWGSWLGKITQAPIIFRDERYTSSEAESILLSAKLQKAKRDDKRDRLAAQILLQNYFEDGAPLESSRATPLLDAQDDK